MKTISLVVNKKKMDFTDDDVVIERLQQDDNFLLHYIRLAQKEGYLNEYDISKDEELNISRVESKSNSVPKENTGTGYIFSSEEEECLIVAVSARPPLFNVSLPLKDRSKIIVHNLWKDVSEELQINATIDELKKKWKSLRESYIRARSNINAKIASGSSNENKIQAEKIRNNHKHYALLQFLDDTLVRRATTSNLDTDSDSTPSSSCVCSSHSKTMNEVDKAFIQALESVNSAKNSDPLEKSTTYHFCMRLCGSLEKLPNKIRNRLEIEFLQKVTECEEEYSSD